MNGSLLDIPQIVSDAKKKGYQTLALVDHHHMYGALKFYKECLAAGIKPIIGLELTLTSDIFGALDVVLLAKNHRGYQHLMQISSQLSLTGALSFDDYHPYQDQIAVVLRTDEGILAKYLYQNHLDEAKALLTHVGTYASEVYLGLDLNDYSVEMQVAPKLEALGSTIIINKVQYLEKSDRRVSQVLKQILGIESKEEGLFSSEDIYYHLKTLEEQRKMYAGYAKAIRQSLTFIDACDLRIDLSNLHLPKYPLKDKDAYQKLIELTDKGLKRRLMQNHLYKENFSHYKERLDYELQIIHQMGYEDYFLIVWDFVLYAKKQGILVGPGRGSAAGSLVAYVLGIVDVDPLAFDLYFERFLNPERITMPDIDMDFPDDKREDVIRYTIDKYGKDRVVSIITFGTFQGKSAIRDVGRVLEVDTVILDELSKNLSDSANSIEVFRETHPKEYSYYMNIDEIKDLMQIAEKLNGLVKHVSTHAAGVIISSEDIRRYTPIQQGLMDAYQTQYEASDLESLGLLKFDFLGLKNLSMIKETLNLIRDKDNLDINIYKIPLDDPATFKLLKDVKTLGVFQLESRGMMDLVANMQIETFEDIATCISLFRPGPMENIPAFLRRRRHEESISYPHIDLQPILASTNGIIVYQEQIMAIANRFAGYSLGEADVLRRAVSKKKRSILENERKKFIRGAKQKGYPERVANDIYDYIVKFANYGFNKSHAVAYAMVGYWMAYLKANYSNHFMSVLLNAQIGSASGTRRYAKECQRLGIGILPPRINLSGVNYLPEDGNLRYPIQGIKGIGPKAAEQIVEIQNEKPVENLIDFVMRRKGLAINILEAMIYAGMFDAFNLNKRTMIENLPRLLQFADFNYQNETFHFLPFEEYDYETLHSMEKDLLGINFKYHILHKYDTLVKEKHYTILSDALEAQNDYVNCIAVLASIKVIKTKKQEEMAFVELEDLFNSVEGVIFPKTYSRVENTLKNNAVYHINGRKETRRNKQQLIIDQIYRLEEA